MTSTQYKGLSLPQVLMKDPDWFFWVIEQTTAFRGPLAAEAQDLAAKARRVRIPKPDPSKWAVEYIFANWRRSAIPSFYAFEFVESNRPPHQGSSLTYRSTYVDFSLVYRHQNFDKSGYKKFLSTFRHHYFGSSSAKMTRKRCEAFFDHEDNFA